MFETCAWRTCPDYVGVPILTSHVNFFVADTCGGFSSAILISDIVMALLVTVVLFGIIYVSRKIFVHNL